MYRHKKHSFSFGFLSFCCNKQKIRIAKMTTAAWRIARCSKTTKCGSSGFSASVWTKWRDSSGGCARSEIFTIPRISKISRFDWIPGGRGWTQSSDSSFPNFNFVRRGENSLLNSSWNKVGQKVKWTASSQWSSFLYCLMRNSDKMTIEKTYLTLTSSFKLPSSVFWGFRLDRKWQDLAENLI